MLSALLFQLLITRPTIQTAYINFSGVAWYLIDNVFFFSFKCRHDRKEFAESGKVKDTNKKSSSINIIQRFDCVENALVPMVDNMSDIGTSVLHVLNRTYRTSGLSYVVELEFFLNSWKHIGICGIDLEFCFRKGLNAHRLKILFFADR